MDVLGRLAVVLLVLFLLALPVITLLKGRIGLAVVGVLVHPCWLFGACLLAKPGSAWAQWFYDDAKLARARVRHGVRYPQDGRPVEVWRPPAP